MAVPTPPKSSDSTKKSTRAKRSPSVWISLPQEVIDYYAAEGKASEYDVSAQQVIRAHVMKRYNERPQPGSQGGVPVASV